MDGKPYRVRTFYFGCDDSSKKTLILTHGFMANIVSFFTFLKLISKHYRVIAYDNCNWGLNTRSEKNSSCEDIELAEAWVLEFHEKTIEALDDVPEKFFLAGHSHGGYQFSLFASHHPECVERLFLISPAGTQGYNEATYDPYNVMNMAEGWRRYTKKEIDEFVALFKSGNHPFAQIHGMPGFA